MGICEGDAYHPEQNEKGYINLGTATNIMCNDLLAPKITDSSIWSCDESLLQYKQSSGIFELREVVARFMTEFLETYKPIDPDNLFCSVGVTSSFDLLGHCLADPGDVIMTAAPVYGRIHTNFIQRGLVKIWPIPIYTEDCTEKEPVLTIQKVRDSFLKAREQGKNVRALLIINPSNPLGDVYSPDLVHSILEFCHEVRIHVIFDEVYALSIFNEDASFRSVLTFEKVPDPNSVHVLYGLSKDQCLPGLRLGVIHTLNKDLQQCLQQLTMFQVIPYPLMGIIAKIVSDFEFWRKFAKSNKERLRESYSNCKKRLEKFGAHVRNSKAGFFLWVNFREKCGIRSFEDERNLFLYLMETHRLFVAPGQEFFCAQPGWFRIVFTRGSSLVSAGLSRLEEGISKYSSRASSTVHVENLVQPAAVSADCGKDQQKESLENLVALLKRQILTSDLLSENAKEPQ